MANDLIVLEFGIRTSKLARETFYHINISAILYFRYRYRVIIFVLSHSASVHNVVITSVVWWSMDDINDIKKKKKKKKKSNCCSQGDEKIR
jgi:hypothetical protein